MCIRDSVAIENVMAATSTPSVPEAAGMFAVTKAAFEHKTVDHFDDALRPVYTLSLIHIFTLSYKDGATAEVKAASDQSDAAVKFAVDKTVMGAGTPLPGAKFQAWNTDDEISIGSAAGNVAVRADAGAEVSIRKAVSRCV